MKRLAAKITAFFRGLVKPRAEAGLDEEPGVRDDSFFGGLANSSADPFGASGNWTEASPVGIGPNLEASETGLLSDPNGLLPVDDDEWLVFDMTTLSPKEAHHLAVKEPCPLYFDGLLDLTPEAAKAFVHHGWVAFDALTTVCDKTAEVLAGYQGTYLFLRGLKTLSANAAASLRSNPRIVLPETFTEAP